MEFVLVARRHDDIEEHAFVVVPQVGQVVGEVGEVEARADAPIALAAAA